MKSKTKTKKVSTNWELQENQIKRGESSILLNKGDFSALIECECPCLYCYTGQMSIFQELQLNEKPKKSNQKARKSKGTKKV